MNQDSVINLKPSLNLPLQGIKDTQNTPVDTQRVLMAENHFADLDCEFEDEELQMMGTLDVNEDQPIRVTFAMNGGSEDIGALEAGA